MISNLQYNVPEVFHRPAPEAPPDAPLAEKYIAALRVVAEIDEALTRGVVHYRRLDGRLLGTLDEVVRAIIDDDLMDEARPE